MLQSLGINHGTDKATHGFLSFYDSFMNSSKDKPIHFLEIGVFYGASLKMWADYFTHAESKIVGADWFKGIQGNSSTFADPKFILNQKVDPRIQFVELNQASLQELQTFKNTSTMFDYILDDGSHLMKRIIRFLNQS
jgi:hypothetical protein